MFGFAAGRALHAHALAGRRRPGAVGDCTLAVRHCPGHTPGHVVFHSAEARRAFVGDVLFAGSIGRTDFPGGDFDTLIASITQRLWPMGDDTVFIPGHGPESSFGRERRFNPYLPAPEEARDMPRPKPPSPTTCRPPRCPTACARWRGAANCAALPRARC
jgi:hydroxyacylglutathione hydrolase